MYWIKSGIEILRSRGSLAVVAGMKKPMTTQSRQKSNAKKIKKSSKATVKPHFFKLDSRPLM